MRIGKILMVIVLSGTWLSFTTGYDWAQAWVDKKILAKTELRGDVQQHLKPGLETLYLLPKTEMRVMQNGNAFLRCFLVNNTTQIAIIERADDTIDGFTSEILKNGKWMAFQFDLPSMCGNSAWKQKLDPGKALSIEFDHMESGGIQVPFRLKYVRSKQVIYSNEIMVDIDSVSYREVPRRPM